MVDGNKVNLATSPNTWSWSQGETAPSGYELKKLTEVAADHFWVGMGPKQLTGSSMMEFFGWYYNNISPTVEKDADLEAFIGQFLSDGKLAFEGGMYYWMYRVNGSGRPTLHSVLSGKGIICHDAAITARLINGGCNNYLPTPDGPGRVGYYSYIHNQVYNTAIDSTTVTWTDSSSKTWNLDGMKCSYADQGEQYNNPLEAYCYTAATKN